MSNRNVNWHMLETFKQCSRALVGCDMLEPHRIAQIFLVRDQRILILQRASGRGTGWWSPPGGDLELGEQPSDAAIRETFEETGLWIEDVRFLRSWVFRHPDDSYERHITSFGAAAPTEAIVLSDEHTQYGWIALDEYEQRYCGEHLESAAPEYAAMFREMRADCAAVRKMLSDNKL
jgi:8-oxo-dGTP diphosphatase